MAIVTIDQWTNADGSPRFVQPLFDDRPTFEGDSQNGWTATLDYRVKSVDLLDFLVFVGGKRYDIPIAGGGSVSRIIPLSHPGASRLICTKVGAKMQGGFTPSNPNWCNQWSDARVKCTFSTVPFGTDGSTPFMQVSAEEGAEEYALAGTRLAFGDGTPIQGDASLRVPTAVYSATIYQCVSLGDDVFLPLAGTVNSSPVTLGSYACPAGTVRFDSGGGQVSMASNFQQAWTRQLKFTFRPVPWNQFLKPSGAWDVPLKPDGSTVYTTANFAPLFA